MMSCVESAGKVVMNKGVAGVPGLWSGIMAPCNQAHNRRTLIKTSIFIALLYIIARTAVHTTHTPLCSRYRHSCSHGKPTVVHMAHTAVLVTHTHTAVHTAHTQLCSRHTHSCAHGTHIAVLTAQTQLCPQWPR